MVYPSTDSQTYVHFLLSSRCTANDISLPCDPDKRAAAEQLCNIMNDSSGPFADCINLLLDSDELINIQESCVFDVCAYFDDETLRYQYLCNILETLRITCYENSSPPFSPIYLPEYCPGRYIVNLQILCHENTSLLLPSRPPELRYCVGENKKKDY